VGRASTSAHEESPGSIGQGCRVTPGEGDFKESATESKPPLFGEVRMKRRGKSPPADRRRFGHVNPTRSNAMERHYCGPQVSRRRLEPFRNVRPR